MTPDRTRADFIGPLLMTAYAVLALAATARSVVQILTRFDTAPVPYLLSAFAAAVYLVLAVAFRGPSPQARRIATGACGIELVGVLAIGGWSVASPAAFPDQTVWSQFGRGYGFVPLLLPVLGLWWLSGPTTRVNGAR